MNAIPVVKVSGHSLLTASQSSYGIKLTAGLCGAIRSFAGQEDLNVGIIWINGAASVVADITRPDECVLVEVALNDYGKSKFPPRVEQLVADIKALFQDKKVVVQIDD